MREVVAALLVAAALGAGCSGDDAAAPAGSRASSTPAAPTTAPEPVSPPEPPQNGACYRLTYDEAVAPTVDAAPVRCRRPHTARTFRVGRLDRGVEVDSARAQRQAQETCTQRLGPHLGAGREALRLSLVETVWFTPTLEEAAAGARWFRCDAIATAGAGRLLRLPRPLEGSLDALALCATAEPGRRASRRVACSARHAWRAIATVDLGGSAYPTAQQVADAMQGTCRSRARDAAADPLDLTWSEERPTRAQWRAGQRYGVCWVPD